MEVIPLKRILDAKIDESIPTIYRALFSAGLAGNSDKEKNAQGGIIAVPNFRLMVFIKNLVFYGFSKQTTRFCFMLLRNMFTQTDVGKGNPPRVRESEAALELVKT